MLSSPINVVMSQMLPRCSFATKRLLEPAACGSRHDPCLTLQYAAKAWASMTLTVAPVSMLSKTHTKWQTDLTQICYKGLQQAAPHSLWFSLSLARFAYGSGVHTQPWLTAYETHI